jgi:hypothetical protein
MTNQQQGNPQNKQGSSERHDGASQHTDKGAMGNKPAQSGDRGRVGEDTDGDGKVVKPGQKPGQSHGTGVINK